MFKLKTHTHPHTCKVLEHTVFVNERMHICAWHFQVISENINVKEHESDGNNARLGAHEEVKIRKFKHEMEEDNLITGDDACIHMYNESSFGIQRKREKKCQ